MSDVGIIFGAPMVRALLAGTKTQTRRLRGLGPNLRVRLPYEVKSDVPEIVGEVRCARPGIHEARMNAQGAVAVLLGGKLLGVKPGEFDLVCPYAAGTTRIVDGRWRIEPAAGQRLWVRESAWIAPPGFAEDFSVEGNVRDDKGESRVISYDADSDEDARRCARDFGVKLSSPIYMPRWASRITLEVTDIRLERVHEITEEDARAEGLSAEWHESWSAYDPKTDGYPSFLAEPSAEDVARRGLENLRHQKHQVWTARDVFRRTWNTLHKDRHSRWLQSTEGDRSPWVWAISFRRTA